MARQRPRRQGTSTFHLSWQMSLFGVYLCLRMGVAPLARFKALRRACLKSAPLSHFLPPVALCSRPANLQIIFVLFCIMQLKLNNMATCPRDLNCAWPLLPIPLLAFQSLASVVHLGYSWRVEDSGETSGCEHCGRKIRIIFMLPNSSLFSTPIKHFIITIALFTLGNKI